MSYRIAQDYDYAGNDYWLWSAWIEASDEELDQVDTVTWILHPSFPQSRVVSSDRQTNFRLRTAGWGVFTLQAEVTTNDKQKVALKHSLVLEYPTEDTAPTNKSQLAHARANNPTTVFLSYSGQHARAATRLREQLEHAGLNVLDQSRIEAGIPWAEAIDQMIAMSDTVIGIVSDDEVSPLVNAELESAVDAAKPVLPVSFRSPGEHVSHSPGSGLRGRLGELQVLSLEAAEPNTGAITDAIGRLMQESTGVVVKNKDY